MTDGCGCEWEPVDRLQYGAVKATVHRRDTQNINYGGGAHEYSFNSMYKNTETGKMEFNDILQQDVRFVEAGDNGSVIPGITDEQLLICMIDRQNRLNSRFPSREGSIVVTKLEEALMWKEARSRERDSRNVLGKLEK